jgi:hypothetical protein
MNVSRLIRPREINTGTTTTESPVIWYCMLISSRTRATASPEPRPARHPHHVHPHVAEARPHPHAVATRRRLLIHAAQSSALLGPWPTRKRARFETSPPASAFARSARTSAIAGESSMPATPRSAHRLRARV